MPTVNPPKAPMPRALLGYDGTDFYVLRTDATGHLQIDVLTSALPAGAATAANQDTEITALQLIDNLYNALQSVATDRLRVRGENQLFSFKGVLCVARASGISGAGGYGDSDAVPAGEIWVVTTVSAGDSSSATTQHRFFNRHDGTDARFYTRVATIPAAEHSTWGGLTTLDEGDIVRAYFIGGLAGDTVRVELTGYRMTLEA